MDEPHPARLVADADVLAADLLRDGHAREALDIVRAHSWVELAASDPLLADARAVVARLADSDLAEAWRERIDDLRVRVEHPPGDHPALASAAAGNAAHVLSFDESLRTAETGVRIREHVATSVKHPAGFYGLFDPEKLHPTVVGGAYPGPDRDPRA
jgi:predicted nucleic acid-binding protein